MEQEGVRWIRTRQLEIIFGILVGLAIAGAMDAFTTLIEEEVDEQQNRYFKAR